MPEETPATLSLLKSEGTDTPAPLDRRALTVLVDISNQCNLRCRSLPWRGQTMNHPPRNTLPRERAAPSNNQFFRTPISALALMMLAAPTVQCAQENELPGADQVIDAGVQATEGKSDLRQLNLESFERVWSIVNDRYWDPEFGGLDWQAVADELRPRIMEASTLPAARAVLRDMVSRLQLSHFGIIPQEDPGDRKPPPTVGTSGGETGLDARVIGGKALVTTVDESSSADQLGVRPGWEIIRINDYDVVASLGKLDRELPDTPSKRVKMAAGMVIRVRSGVGESVAITFRNGDDEVVDLTIPFGEPRGRKARVGNFGYSRVRIDVQTLEDSIGYIAVNKFLDPVFVMTAFNAALESFMEADGLILDLRGNSGGKDFMAMAMMGWLAPKKWVAGRVRTRGNEIEMTVRPRSRVYEGPVAVLTDGLTGSSAEFVAAALQEVGRACIIGTRTKGEALPAEYTTLPNGDVFLYAVADFVTGAGKRLEGVGVAPDIEVSLTQASLLQGRDLVLEAALEWVRSPK
jgi:carboxyl-terminal processing protease